MRAGLVGGIVIGWRARCQKIAMGCEYWEILGILEAEGCGRCLRHGDEGVWGRIEGYGGDRTGAGNPMLKFIERGDIVMQT